MGTKRQCGHARHYRKKHVGDVLGEQFVNENQLKVSKTCC